jgi:DNA repair exonuclease SbcCD nuclease subunit
LVVIAHVSDTHLGHRPDDVRPGTIGQEVRPVEDDFYKALEMTVKEIVDRKDEIDLVIHSGDLFDSPWSYNPYPPPEMARKIVAKAFRDLQSANIPIVIIDGNHGRYVEYKHSTLDEYAIAFDNTRAFTYWSFRETFREKQPLYADIKDEVRVYAFPYIEPSTLETIGLYEEYQQWLKSIKLDKDKINIAIAHGSPIDGTLDQTILNMEFDYIALGHEHCMRRVTEKAWFSGSTERWKFDEKDHKKGFLIVQADKDKAPDIRQVHLTLPRPMVNETVQVQLDDSSHDIVKRIFNLLDNLGFRKPYDYETAARVRIALEGEISGRNVTQISEAIDYAYNKGLSDRNLNIIQLKIGRPPIKASTLPPSISYVDIEYLIEDPAKDFKNYIEEKRKKNLIPKEYNLNLLTELFVEAMKKWRKSDEGFKAYRRTV